MRLSRYLCDIVFEIWVVHLTVSQFMLVLRLATKAESRRDERDAENTSGSRLYEGHKTSQQGRVCREGQKD